MSEIWISMREKKLTDTLTLMTDTLTRVTAERDMLTLDLHTETAAVVALRAERDKLAAELKTLRDSGVELPFVTMCQADYQGNLVDYFTAPQLHDYGDRRAMAERERCALLCEKIDDDSYPTTRKWPSDCAEAIRKGEK